MNNIGETLNYLQEHMTFTVKSKPEFHSGEHTTDKYLVLQIGEVDFCWIDARSLREVLESS